MTKVAESSVAVALDSVSSGYRGHKVLDDITLRIHTGSTVGVWGPNGCGKTTLLRVIQGLLPVFSGTAEVLGTHLTRSHHKDVRQRTAYVFQTLNVDAKIPVSAWDVVMMGRYGRIGLLRRPRDSDKKAVASAMEQVGGLHLANRPFGQLSGGEKQRINIARALAQDPSLLLLDEPTTFLDLESQARVRDVVKSIQSNTDMTILIVSHDMDILLDVCGEIVIMDHGRVSQVAKAEDLVADGGPSGLPARLKWTAPNA
jgi:ABC-type cobalamin/Fe3+-siderophores transport system ATPase subunit